MRVGTYWDADTWFISLCVAEKVAPMAGGVLVLADGGVLAVSKLGTKGDPDWDISPVDVDSNTCE